MLKVDDRRLWGNEAADDEDPKLLNSYFVTQPAWDDFFDGSIPLSIARARKGMGKSFSSSALSCRVVESAVEHRGHRLQHLAPLRYYSTAPGQRETCM